MFFSLGVEWPIETSLRTAKIAEKHNFNGLFTGEHHLPGSIPSTLLWLTRFIGEFPQFRFSTDVALLPFYHPVRMASEAAMLDHMTKGKFDLGIGLGYVHSEFELYGLNIRKRRSMFEESLTIMKKLWAEDEVDYKGKYWKIKGKLPIKPFTQGGPKIWIGGQVRPAIERAARMGDVFTGGISTPIQRFKEFRDIYYEALREIGKDTEKAEFPIMRTVWCDERDDTRDRINRIVSDQYKQSFAIREGHPMQNDEYAIDYEHSVENRCIAGDPDTCIEMVEKYAELGVTGILCFFIGTEHTPKQIDESIKLFGQKVQNRLK
jgi:alkanesulfonate monooxygenase SsuD/methylene tetrahydromethanopterin reductase-like flavin-dependent oxidoreductase (luciferase family)